MSFLSKPSTTTALLAAIAVLLLILVVQNGARSTLPSSPPPMEQTSDPHMPFNHPPIMGDSMPSQEMAGGKSASSMGGAGPTDAEGNFDPGAMIFGALTCPGNSSTTLADPGCTGADAEARKNMVRDGFAKQQPLRDVMDKIIAKYGEGALTEQALQIRRSRRSGTGQ